MTETAIPSWTASGVLPPIDSTSPTSSDRSPYEVKLDNLIRHFNDSAERRAILAGLLDFRAGLHGLGIVRGFQWLDGSFLEHVEARENRSPRDIDVVTFYHLPEGLTQGRLLARASPFDSRHAKSTYHVDAYFVQLDARSPEVLVNRSVYWYSIWSHRRDGLWKGFLQIDLAPDADAMARKGLVASSARGGQP